VSNARWFYARGSQQTGPVSFDQLRQLAASGQLGPQNMIWAEGTPAWVPAGTQAALFAEVVASAAVAAAPNTAGALDYFEPAAGLPPRAAAALRGHGRPSGDVGDWPLDDARVAQFKQTLALRKKITAAAGLYRLFLLLTIIALVFMLFGLLFAVGSGARGTGGVAAMGMGLMVAMMGGFCVLYYFAWRATMRSQRWAPLTMFILIIISILINVGSLALQASAGTTGDTVAGIVGIIVILGIGGLFAFVSWRSYAAIPRYLGQPAWCQELIVSAGM
jgi:hypothetical protein